MGIIACRSELVLPAMVQNYRTLHIVPASQKDKSLHIVPASKMQEFLEMELLTPKLDRLHDHLWLAGLPLPPRSLQRQAMMGRIFHITERPDEHLVWHHTKLLLKPLPDFLLCREFWDLYICGDPELHRSAIGLLLSYAWLIEHKSDFDLAQRQGLISADIGWAIWTGFMTDFVSEIDLDRLDQVDRRYLYGELRLSRLDSLTRFLPSMWSRDHFVRGYLSTSTWYQAFFETNFSWLLAVFAFFSMLLSAMQVGLATDQLYQETRFGRLSYGIAWLAIATIFFGLLLLWLVWVFLFCYHLFSTRLLNKGIQRTRSNSSLSA